MVQAVKLLSVEQVKEITKMHSDKIINRFIKRVNKNILIAAKRGCTMTFLNVKNVDNEILATIEKMCNDNGFQTTVDSKYDLDDGYIYFIQITWN